MFLFSLLFFSLFQNLYWADSGDLVAIASDTSFYILKYNVWILKLLILFLTCVILLSSIELAKCMIWSTAFQIELFLI